MQDDELRTPLKPRTRLQRLWDKRPTPAAAAWGVAFLALAAAATWAVMQPMPESLKPVATARIQPVDPTSTASTGKAGGDGIVKIETTRGKEQTRISAGEPAGEEDKRAEEEFEPLGEGEVEITVPGAESLPRSPREAKRRKLAMLGLVKDTPLPRAPIRSVSEKTSIGYLPKVARSGKKPWQVYSKPVPNKVITSAKPKIAIVIGGLGINPALSERAVKSLPGMITLAYAPVSRRLQAHIDKARRKGHEVLLQLPMEPWGYPAANPGPRTLLVSASARENRSNLLWFMSRAAGYIGFVNYAGGRFLAEGEALAPLLHEINRRGLIFLDDGSNGNSMLPELASVISLPALRADARIDSEVNRSAIEAALVLLERKAARNGHAIGMGSAFPETLDALETWLNSLAASGAQVEVVPLSALLKLKRRG